MSKTAEFNKIKEAFEKRDKDFISKGQLPMRSTEKGFWGVSNMDDIFEWFTKMNFPKNTKFIDLGSGDGRVALIASLFVDAAGVEFDAELANVANNLGHKLGSKAKFLHGDFHGLDFSEYDILFMYADNNFDALEEKLKKELRGTLHLYHDTYRPYYLKKGKITWINQLPVFSYTNATREE